MQNFHLLGYFHFLLIQSLTVSYMHDDGLNAITNNVIVLKAFEICCTKKECEKKKTYANF